ncbi:hypothetical protein [Chimaeribacter californicus]|uniref:hypothetical protein n=1 Tax=Chimaeribacter californicus TaxID=2060067 RepID=UPI0011AF739B|nr:hypothetical protein [Chimaeribacter californicus]
MARRTELKGIANSLNGSFVSRNNDYNGYWSIGQLKLFAIERHLTSVRFTFPRHKSSASFVLIDNIAWRYTYMLADLLAKQQIPDAWVKEVSITIDFDTIDEAAQSVDSTVPGKSFKCLCQIIDDNGCFYSSVIYGRCLPHSTARELRSTRQLFS